MTPIAERLQAVRATLPEGVTLVAVSKFHPAESLWEAYEAGQRVFGESRENELRAKDAYFAERGVTDVAWHFIGHLQTNKVKYVVPLVRLIQSVDSERLLDEVQRQAVRWADVRLQRFGTTDVDVLLQLHVAREETKSGFSPSEVMALMERSDVASRWPNVRLRGIMAMASLTDDEALIRHDFETAVATWRALLDGPLAAQGIDAGQFAIRSMGMTDDYGLAIACGSDMVRIGSAIFGHRNYPQP